jgi:PKD repeat protein
MTGNDLLAGPHTVNTNLGLEDGTIYSLSFDATDLAGNSATTVSKGQIRVDTSLAPVARFTWSKDAIANYKINFDASSSIKPQGSAGLTYSWDFGDSGSGSGVSVSHTYGSSTAATVTLTVTDNTNGATSTSSLVVNPVFRASALAPALSNVKATGYVGTVDLSYSGAANTMVNGKIAWGDGKVSLLLSLPTNTTVAHLYNAARKYTVKVTVNDGKRTATTSAFLTVNQINVSGNLAAAGSETISGVVMTLKQNTVKGVFTRKKAVTDSNGAYLFKNVVPGSYVVVPSKRGYSFVEPNPTLTILTGIGDNVVSNLTISATTK